ncbi:MAG: NUDIX domain-containing protein [Actinomycetota bacterium]|nr:NUDIX domain-containing protein [Actinomycetota bacterium]
MTSWPERGGDAPCWAHHGDRLVINAIRADVAGREPVDERERASISSFLEHVDRLVAPFDEEASPVHVTGSAVIVGERGVVLHRHRRLGIWVQPGGHIDTGETPWEAALREAREETGLPVVAAPIDPVRRRPPLLHVDVHDGGRGHRHLDLRYLMHCDPIEPAPPPGESQDVEWLDLDTAIDRTDDGLAGLLRHLRNHPPPD